MRRMPELMQLDSGKSTMRNLPPKGTAGLERQAVRCLRREPRPPARIRARVLRVRRLTNRGLDAGMDPPQGGLCDAMPALGSPRHRAMGPRRWSRTTALSRVAPRPVRHSGDRCRTDRYEHPTDDGSSATRPTSPAAASARLIAEDTNQPHGHPKARAPKLPEPLRASSRPVIMTPSRCWGGMPTGDRVTVRAFLPQAERVRLAGGGRGADPHRGDRPLRLGGRGGRRSRSVTAWSGRTRPATAQRLRPLLLPDPARGLRPAPLRRGPALARLPLPRLPPARGGGDRRRPVRRLGAQRRTRQRGGRLQRAGTGAPTPCACAAATGVWELFIPGIGRGRLLQVRDSATAPATPTSRSTPTPTPSRSAPRPPG